MEAPKSKKNIRPKTPRIAQSELVSRTTNSRHEEERKCWLRRWRPLSWPGTWHTEPACFCSSPARRGDIECGPRAHWARARETETSLSGARIGATSASESAVVAKAVRPYYGET